MKMSSQASRKRQRQGNEDHQPGSRLAVASRPTFVTLLFVASVASSQHGFASATPSSGQFRSRKYTFVPTRSNRSLLAKIRRGGSSPNDYNNENYNYESYNSQQPPPDAPYYQQGDGQADEQQFDNESYYYNTEGAGGIPHYGGTGGEDSWPSSYQGQEDPQYNAPPPPPNQASQQSGGYGYGAPPPPPEQQYPGQQQQQPPPPLSAISSIDPARSDRTPIHYKFPSANAGSSEKDGSSQSGDADGDERGDEDIYDDERKPKFASPRDDAVTRYMMTKRGKLQLLLSSALVGGSLGAFGGKSLLHVQNMTPVFTTCFLLSFFAAWLLRNPYGELIRAMGLAILLVLQRTRAIRRDYPTWPYVPSFFHLKSRMRPFPPSKNPWRYTPRRPSDVEFQMFPSVVAMGLVGSAVGGSIPLVPTWIGSLSGAGAFALSTTLPNARGDLCRILGMRVVATTLELWDIQADLEIIPKMGVVGGKIMDKILILDRKHRIKDRLVTVLSWGYDNVMRQAENARGGRDGGDRDRDRDRQRPDGDDDDRRRGRDDDDRGDRRRGRPPPEERDGRRGRFDANDDRDRRRPRDEDVRRGGPPRRDGGPNRDGFRNSSSRDDDRGRRMRGDDGDDFRAWREGQDDRDGSKGDEPDRRRRDDRGNRDDSSTYDRRDDDDSKQKKGRRFWN